MWWTAFLIALASTPALAAEDVDGSLAKLPPKDRSGLLDRMEQDLFDGPASRLRSVRLIDQGRICGRVNPKNRMGAYIGYRSFMFDQQQNDLVLGGDDADVTSKALVAAVCDKIDAEGIKKLIAPKP